MNHLNKIIKWMQIKVKEAHAKGVVVGISGGIDSALVAYLAKKAFENNFIGLLMPINKECKSDLDDALLLVQQFDIKYQIIDLEEEYKLISRKCHLVSDVAKGNLQARLRMATLYAVAQQNNYLVLGTDNKSEYQLGYFTKWGDGACDLQPIAHLYKSQVYQYAKLINIPQSILDKKPSAGFFANQYDEEQLGFSYDDFEKYNQNILDDSKLIKKIERQIQSTNHKREPIAQFDLFDEENKIENWLSQINQNKIRLEIKKLIKQIRHKFLDLNLDVCQKQLLIKHNKDLIIAISFSQDFVNLKLKPEIINELQDQLIQLKYQIVNNVIKIELNQKINFNLINKIINNSIKNKKIK